MAKIKTMEINGKPYDIHAFTGVVLEEKQWSETEVSGEGGESNGSTRGGTGSSYTAPIKIESKTTRFNQFILQDREKKEKSFKFENLDISCRKGGRMSVVWGIKEGKESGSYWFIYNHDTRDVYETKDFKGPFRPGIIMLGAGLLIACFFAHFWGRDSWQSYLVLLPLSAIAVYVLYYLILKKSTLRQFQKTDAYKALFTQLDDSGVALAA